MERRVEMSLRPEPMTLPKSGPCPARHHAAFQRSIDGRRCGGRHVQPGSVTPNLPDLRPQPQPDPWAPTSPASVGCDLRWHQPGVRLRDRRGEHLGGTTSGLLVQPPEPTRRVRTWFIAAQRTSRESPRSLSKGPVLRPHRLSRRRRLYRSATAPKRVRAWSPPLESLRSGKSIAIAPEGTRSPTPRLLPFKKGPFHMAMQAGVPVVPIVMRNAGQIMAAHSMVIHPGTVDVAVLPPVPDRRLDARGSRRADRRGPADVSGHSWGLA